MSRSICCLFVMVMVACWSMPALLLADDTVCIQCHGGQPGSLGEPIAEWRTSVHAENGISCHDCHGGDPTDFDLAMEPESGFVGAPDYADVPAFCGRCHVGVSDAYQAGAHGKAIDEGGAQCVVCHGNHAIQKTSLDLINEEACSQCHSYERAALIRLSLVETDSMATKIEHDLDRLYRLGLNVDDMQGSLYSQRNSFHQIFHGVDVEHVRQETAGVQSELGKISNEVAAIDSTLGQRKLWGSVVIGLFVLVGVIFLLVRKTYEEDEKG